MLIQRSSQVDVAKAKAKLSYIRTLSWNTSLTRMLGHRSQRQAHPVCPVLPSVARVPWATTETRTWAHKTPSSPHKASPGTSCRSLAQTKPPRCSSEFKMLPLSALINNTQTYLRVCHLIVTSPCLIRRGVTQPNVNKIGTYWLDILSLPLQHADEAPASWALKRRCNRN